MQTSAVENRVSIEAFQRRYSSEKVEYKIVPVLLGKDEKIFQSFLLLEVNHIIREVGLAMLESVEAQ